MEGCLVNWHHQDLVTLGLGARHGLWTCATLTGCTVR
jgi:hypothetical protein